MLVNKRYDYLQQVTLLPNLRVCRMVSIPRQLRKRWCSADQVKPIRQPVLLHFKQPVSPPVPITCLNRQHVQHRIPPPFFHPLRQKDSDLRIAGLILRAYGMHPKTIGIAIGLRSNRNLTINLIHATNNGKNKNYTRWSLETHLASSLVGHILDAILSQYLHSNGRINRGHANSERNAG